MPDYGSLSYWDERYAEVEEIYDWYQDYSVLRPYLKSYLLDNVQDFEILIPGCGNSSLGVNLFDEGFENITNIDISSVVISQMNDLFRNRTRESMEYIVADARNLDGFPSSCFNLIIDKGLFDSLLCSEFDNIQHAKQYLKEMYRVLKHGSYFVMITHGSPETRLGYLRKGAKWDVHYTSAPKTRRDSDQDESELNDENNNLFIYVCQKPYKI